jgi:hypothetical protein
MVDFLFFSYGPTRQSHSQTTGRNSQSLRRTVGDTIMPAADTFLSAGGFVNRNNYINFAGDFARFFCTEERFFSRGSWTYENNHYICTPKVKRDALKTHTATTRDTLPM